MDRITLSPLLLGWKLIGQHINKKKTSCQCPVKWLNSITCPLWCIVSCDSPPGLSSMTGFSLHRSERSWCAEETDVTDVAQLLHKLHSPKMLYFNLQKHKMNIGYLTCLCVLHLLVSQSFPLLRTEASHLLSHWIYAEQLINAPLWVL